MHTTPTADSPSDNLHLANGKTATDAERAQLHGVLREFSTVLLMTYDRKGKHPRLTAQPMRVARLENDCTLQFITRLDTHQADDSVRHDGHVTAQSWNRQLSLNGTYDVTQDRHRLAAVWSVAFNVWFPGGKDDANACLLTFQPRDAELWDSSGLKGLRFLLSSARALITRQPPQSSPDQHATMKLYRD